MARNEKPVKIKRYKNTMGGKSQSVRAVKRYIPFVAGAVLLVITGFVLGKPIMDFISGRGKDDSSVPDNSRQTEYSQPTATPQATPQHTQRPESGSRDETDIPVVPVSDEKVYYYVNAANLTTEDGINSTIARMETKGATHLVFDAKNPDGYVNYNSQNRYARQLKSNTQVDVTMLTAKLKAKGMTAVARVYTFMDKMISTVERSTAVMYRGTDTRWLDTSAALGGKAWANPASNIMQDYIITLTDELLSMGVSDVIYAGFSTPTGYSLDKRDFGASQQQVLANMKNLIVTLQAKISAKGGTGLWQFEYSSVTADGSYAQYIVHPYQLGAENIIITAKGTDMDRTMVDGIKTAVPREGISSVTMWFTDNTNTEVTHIFDSYFTH